MSDKNDCDQPQEPLTQDELRLIRSFLQTTGKPVIPNTTNDAGSIAKGLFYSPYSS